MFYFICSSSLVYFFSSAIVDVFASTGVRAYDFDLLLLASYTCLIVLTTLSSKTSNSSTLFEFGAYYALHWKKARECVILHLEIQRFSRQSLVFLSISTSFVISSSSFLVFFYFSIAPMQSLTCLSNMSCK